MGWKGMLRSIRAAERRADEGQMRLLRQHERSQKRKDKIYEEMRAFDEVSKYHDYINSLLSLHSHCSRIVNWHVLHSSKSPTEPINNHLLELSAEEAYDNFRPSFWDRLFGRTQKKKQMLQKAIEIAHEEDTRNYQSALGEYRSEYQDWVEITNLAGKIIANDVDAYIEALQELNPHVSG